MSGDESSGSYTSFSPVAIVVYWGMYLETLSKTNVFESPTLIS